MSEYSVLIKKALDVTSIEYTHLTKKIGDICIKDELDVIINNVDRAWSPLKATVVSVVAKLKYPEWDTRYHQIQLGGKYSLRNIDKNNISNYLHKKGLYNTATEFALTRSFEKAEPFNKSYTGKISPKECKNAFLNIVDIINTTSNIQLLNDILAYLMLFLKQRREKNKNLKNSIVESSKEINLLDISNVLEEINTLNHSSVVPVIIVHTLLSTIQPYLWTGISIKKLKEHTSPDNHSNSYGDVEGINNVLKPVIVIEVKHKIAINETIITTFDKKTNELKIPLKFILTTIKTLKKFENNNISIDTVANFTLSYLQQALMFEPKICLIFIKELRTNITSYVNISLSIKESVNKILTSLLVSASP
jgi:hypothetical protein